MKRNAISLALSLCAAACGGSPDSMDAGADDVAGSAQLFTVRRDERKCSAPACGGFWASATTTDASPVYVADLDLSKAGLDAATEAQVRGAPAEELLFKARVGTDSKGLRKLLVKDAWRGMPGVVPAATDTLFSVAARSPQHTCVAAPCNNQIATAIANGKTTDLTRVAVQRAAKAFVDQQWLQNRAVAWGALLTAHVAAGQKLAAGTETVLDASQVWIHLPESAGPCAAPRQQACGASQVQAFVRTPDRCVEAVGCVTPGMCPRMQPSCPDGYVASTWASAPNACTATACDPAWVVR